MGAPNGATSTIAFSFSLSWNFAGFHFCGEMKASSDGTKTRVRRRNAIRL
jgi:hypothetical protein